MRGSRIAKIYPAPTRALSCEFCAKGSRLRPFSPLHIVTMTKLLDQAVEAVRRLSSDDQDDIARAIMQLAGSDLPAPVILSPEEREAIARSKAAADRGEFATEEQVRAVWAKHGL